MQDYSRLSDSELIAETARIRAELEHVPQTAASREELGQLYDALGEESDLRVSALRTGR